jgi:hypothetical protein
MKVQYWATFKLQSIQDHFHQDFDVKPLNLGLCLYVTGKLDKNGLRGLVMKQLHAFSCLPLTTVLDAYSSQLVGKNSDSL